MGLIARILDSFKGKDGEPSAKVAIFKGDNITARIFNPPGVDARPLDDDICFTEDSEDTEGGKDILGFIDPKNEPVAEKGEYRVYTRDSDGNIVGSIHIDKTGLTKIVNELISIGIGTAMDELVTEIQNLTTFGSPTFHKVTDSSKILIELKLQQLLTVIGD